MRRLLVPLALFVFLGVLGLAWLRMHDADPPAAIPDVAPAVAATAGGAPIIDKQPPVVSTRRFDPAAPSPDMPPLHPGEAAECDSSFMSGAVVGGQPRRTSANTATVTITQIRMTLQLVITIWVPEDVTQKVLEHEEGHRQISESYYETAGKLAEQIAAPYIGKQLTVTGDNLDAEANKLLQQIGAEITAEYNKQLNPDPAQLRYDDITDHSRNDISARDAVAQVLTNR